MKELKIKRVLPHAMVALLTVFTISACETATTGSDPQSTSNPSENMDANGKYQKPVTMTWAVQTAAASKLLDNETWEDNRWSRLFKDKLNIDLQVAFTADSSTDAYKNKLNAIIASGDLPDVFKTQDTNVFLQLAQNGQLADLTEVYNKYATDSIKEYQKRFADSFKGATIDGKLYAIPRMNDNFHEAPFLWIREDWLKRTNSQPPKTIEELVALAKKFATEDPDGNGKNGDTIGLALNKDLIRQNHASILGLVSAFGVPGRDESMFYRDQNGKMTFAWIQPNMKPALAALADMYKQGLINKDFTSKSESALVEDITSGKIGMAFGSNWGTWYPYNNVYKKDGVIVRPYPIPTQSGYDYKIGIESNAVGQMTMVRKDYKNPEAVIKMLNLYDETVNYSTKDVYDKYWANEQYRLSPIYIDQPGEVYAADLLKAMDKGSSEGLPPAAKPLYDYIAGFENGTLAKDDNAFGTWGQMSKSGSLPIVLNKYIPDKAIVQSILGIQRPDVWLTNVASLDTLTITTFTDIITGTKPVDYFDTFVQQWLKAGGQKSLDELDKMYPAK
ncbi:extracellular solute-binding protein [Paenibacillus sp. CGMCC 1.16610]|uniref:Extracellular solute-binding protein n=1 Tax=Paenibacillus anseongense TaxID=2682845 RepID=A0ABW9UMH7_9BACL|nr:extracellular solute-binding protein [Paenibacillus sp. CGMCC 1.16610]MBA2939426.1 extracellular solute-binding protein [Paenibacillus sp. CGMCC 1.16610]MVQ39090.1 extracellular solute-binding protein [Paenibacillus anseongense]